MGWLQHFYLFIYFLILEYFTSFLSVTLFVVDENDLAFHDTYFNLFYINSVFCNAKQKKIYYTTDVIVGSKLDFNHCFYILSVQRRSKAWIQIRGQIFLRRCKTWWCIIYSFLIVLYTFQINHATYTVHYSICSNTLYIQI